MNPSTKVNLGLVVEIENVLFCLWDYVTCSRHCFGQLYTIDAS